MRRAAQAPVCGWGKAGATSQTPLSPGDPCSAGTGYSGFWLWGNAPLEASCAQPALATSDAATLPLQSSMCVFNADSSNSQIRVEKHGAMSWTHRNGWFSWQGCGGEGSSMGSKEEFGWFSIPASHLFYVSAAKLLQHPWAPAGDVLLGLRPARKRGVSCGPLSQG